MSDSDVTLDPDSDGDSDATLPPNEEKTAGPSADVATASTALSTCSPLKKKKSLPYQFKKTNSSVHCISDSESDGEQKKKQHASKVKPSLPPKQSSASNNSLHSMSDSETDEESGKICVLKKSSSKDAEAVLKISSKHAPKLDRDIGKGATKNSESKRTSHPEASSLLPKKQFSGGNSRTSSPKAKKQDSGKNSLRDPPSGSDCHQQGGNGTESRQSSSPGPGSSKRPREGAMVTSSGSDDLRPVCPYGDRCYRKNPEHKKEFRHPGDEGNSPPPKKKPKVDVPLLDVAEKYKNARYFNFFLTTVHGIDQQYNAKLAMGIQDILSPKMGTLEASAQFNYMTDIPWLVQQYPAEFRTKPLLIIHGEQRQGKAAMDLAASNFPHVKLCQAKLEIMYGTHHTKMMFLLYKEGMRVVIHTANLIKGDWYQKTQGIWISPLFPKLSNPTDKGDSITMFKHDLLQYISAYGSNKLTEWEKHIREHDMSKAKVYIIGSIPGRHRGDSKSRFGHLKLRQVLQRRGPQSRDVHQWPVIGQFSSIGSMGPNKENWLCAEWLQSLSAGQGDSTGLGFPKLQLIFPSKDNVRLSLEGYPAGGCLPYSINVAKKQTFLHTYFHVWISEVRGRSRAAPHIKTYARISPSGTEMSWFLVTSANLSKAAWGALEKNGSQLMIRSYELGVLFIPEHYGENTFKIMKDQEDHFPGSNTFPVPYDLPPEPYKKQDKPWIWDIPYTDLPDTNGNAWCPS